MGTESRSILPLLRPGTWQVGTDRIVFLCCYPDSHPGHYLSILSKACQGREWLASHFLTTVKDKKPWVPLLVVLRVREWRAARCQSGWRSNPHPRVTLTTTRLYHVLTPPNLRPPGYFLGAEQSCFECPTRPLSGGGAATRA